MSGRFGALRGVLGLWLIATTACVGEIAPLGDPPVGPGTSPEMKLDVAAQPPVIVETQAPPDAGEPSNKPPVVTAGDDVTVTLPDSTATLLGTAEDEDGAIAQLEWTQLSGENANLSGETTTTLTVSGLEEGLYAFRLTVTDDRGAQAFDDVSITVLPAPPPPSPPVTTLRELGTTTAPYGFVEYLPEGYASDTATAFPLLIVLHGIGEEGNGTTQLGSVRVNGPNREIDKSGKKFPLVILTPQSPGWWNSGTLDAFVTYALATYRVDPKRVYLTGLSMGGGGTWDYAAAHGERLAAIVPVCGASGGGNDAHGQYLVDHGVAVWAAHAMDDPTVNVSNTRNWMTGIGHALGEAPADNLMTTYPWNTPDTQTAHFDQTTKQWVWTVGQSHRDANGTPWSPRQFVTLYPNGGHAIWSRMYSDPQVYDWLLAQARP